MSAVENATQILITLMNFKTKLVASGVLNSRMLRGEHGREKSSC
jgi:hypothetical protein